MTWADYYDRFYDWAESTQVRNLSGLTSLGSADEVGEIIIELQVNVPASNRLLRKAVEAKLAFSASDLIEFLCINDKAFAKSDALQKIKWVVKEQEDIYVPSYTDILRVSFTHKFHRGKIADLVSLLSGRDFETRENLETIAADSFKQLREGVEAFVNETNFKRYLMIVRSTGIIDSSLVRF